ncbi:steroid 17-alpha-hydroxylase/17,20 lyase [Nematostella vectensis]|uniref:steroid 17-alpha-hydroxylase/17,20 lyase n=1 Tax=Nematostella vectensis TaxID=45351 RepID=UPI0020772317|nr:steroid 17-alpha-hydroxylase/17,20 lyase [Nematostella vectensis]
MSVQEVLYSLCEYVSIGNVVLLLLCMIIGNFLWSLYDFRGMPPGPRATRAPIIGNLLSFDRGAGDLRNMTNSLRKHYGGIFALQVGSWRMVFAGSPDAVREVLVKRSADYAGRPPFHSFHLETKGGKDIAVGNYGPAWRMHRKLFTTSLRYYLHNVPLLESHISRQVKKLVALFDEEKGSAFNPAVLIKQSVADVITKMTFDEAFNASHPSFDKFFKTLLYSMEDVDLNTQRVALDFFTFTKYLPFETYRKTKEMADYVFNVLKEVVDERNKTFDPSQPTTDLLTALLKARLEAEFDTIEEKQVLLADKYLLNTLTDMFIAGYATVSDTLRWLIVYLVNYPHIQEEIHNALDKVVGSDRTPSLDDRQQLSIIQATIMETLRFTADFTLPHYTLKDTSLCGYRVPKDSVVMVDIKSVHMDPKCWENPTEFNPHRHIDDKGELIVNQGNWLPFSAGRRVCAGEPLAKIEVFLYSSWLLHKFRFIGEEGKPPPSLVPNRGFTVIPKPYKIHAVRRH